jgi:ParB-like nuclease domain
LLRALKRANSRGTVVRYGNSLSADYQPNTGRLVDAEGSASASTAGRIDAVQHSDHRTSQLASNGSSLGSGSLGQTAETVAEVVAVPVLSLRTADSPRLNGEDKAHIARLAETETALPPILVDRRTMRVIDGMHRLIAASLRGRDTIDVIFFDGSEADVFLRAVQENVTHGRTDHRVTSAHV